MNIQDQPQEWDFEIGGYVNFFRKSATGDLSLERNPSGTMVLSLFGEWVHVVPGSPEHAICNPKQCIEALFGSPEFDSSNCDELQRSALEFCRSELVAEFYLHGNRMDEYCNLVGTDMDAKAHIRSIKRSLENEALLSKGMDFIGGEEARIAANSALE